MKKLSVLVVPLFLILSACFEQANAEPKERIPFDKGGANPATVLPSNGSYAEGDRVLAPKVRVPHDVIEIQIPQGEFEFRVGAPGGEMGEWQPVAKLTPEIVRGKIFQFAVKDKAFGEMKTSAIVFNTMLERFLESKGMRTRKDWGAFNAKPDMTEDPWKDLFAVHHTAGQAKSDDETVKQIQVFHMVTRNWSDVGYHFLIGPDGKIFQGRELKYQGAHVAVKGYTHNRGSIGINFLGCYDSVECHGPKYPEVSEATDAMIASMGELIGALSLHYGINIDAQTVKGHKEFAGTATACPGDRVMARMNDIREKAVATKELLAKAMLSVKRDEL